MFLGHFSACFWGIFLDVSGAFSGSQDTFLDVLTAILWIFLGHFWIYLGHFSACFWGIFLHVSVVLFCMFLGHFSACFWAFSLHISTKAHDKHITLRNIYSYIYILIISHALHCNSRLYSKSRDPITVSTVFIIISKQYTKHPSHCTMIVHKSNRSSVVVLDCRLVD